MRCIPLSQSREIMKKIFFLSICLFFNCFFIFCKTDDSVLIPKRIISINPQVTEIIYSFKCEDLIVAVSTYCKFPEAAKNKEKCGNLLEIDIEKILSGNFLRVWDDVIAMAGSLNNSTGKEE